MCPQLQIYYITPVPIAKRLFPQDWRNCSPPPPPHHHHQWWGHSTITFWTNPYLLYPQLHILDMHVHRARGVGLTIVYYEWKTPGSVPFWQWPIVQNGEPVSFTPFPSRSIIFNIRVLGWWRLWLPPWNFWSYHQEVTAAISWEMSSQCGCPGDQPMRRWSWTSAVNQSPGLTSTTPFQPTCQWRGQREVCETMVTAVYFLTRISRHNTRQFRTSIIKRTAA